MDTPECMHGNSKAAGSCFFKGKIFANSWLRLICYNLYEPGAMVPFVEAKAFTHKYKILCDMSAPLLVRKRFISILPFKKYDPAVIWYSDNN